MLLRVHRHLQDMIALTQHWLECVFTQLELEVNRKT